MAKRHELKTLPVYFDAVARGDKTFEVRKNDRDFQTGDTLVLREFDPAKVRLSPPWAPGSEPEGWVDNTRDGYTGETIERVISYVLHDPDQTFGLQRGYVVLGFWEHPVVRQASVNAVRRALEEPQ